MHSSMMHTACLLTVSCSIPCISVGEGRGGLSHVLMINQTNKSNTYLHICNSKQKKPSFLLFFKLFIERVGDIQHAMGSIQNKLVTLCLGKSKLGSCLENVFFLGFGG